MPTNIINETMNTEMLVRYMALPMLIAVGIMILTSIVVNSITVSLLQKWVANVNTNQNSQSEESGESVYEPEDEDAQRIANIYKDF